jgi:hypothetical protein
MKKLSFIPLLMLCCLGEVSAQNYGSFASGVFLTKNGSAVGYGVTGDAVNQIAPNPFSGTLGTFQQNSGTLILNGGETKTYKQNWANVCGSTLYYSAHTTGTAGTYSTISLPYKAGCNGGTFSDGLGNCGGNDQKWSTSANSIDLTTLCPGNYTLDVYYSVPGSNNNTYDCGDISGIGSAASPAGSVTFTITGTAPTVTAGATNCNTGAATLTASNYTGNITWSNGQTGASITAPVGSYTATSNLNGCTSPKSGVATVAPCAAACPANGNLLVNGSFEDAVVPPANGWAALTQPGWMELAPGNNGLIETWKGSAYDIQAPSGNQFVELNYLTLGTIAQDVNVVPNQSMTLSFYHRARIFYADHNESVRVDVVDLNTNQVIHTITSNVMGDWENVTTTFTPTTDKIEVRFVSLNASGDGNDYSFGNFLDDIALNYNSCLCGSPITIVGDTTVCLASGEYSTLRVDGCAGGNISWVYNNQGDPYVSQTTYGFTGVSYVASCSQPGCPDTTFSPSVTVSCDAQQRGINNSALSTEPVSLSVAPNPVMDAAKLKLSGFNNGEISIQITNLNGSVISNTKSINVNGIDLPLDMSQLRSGMYFIKAQQGNKIAVSKVIKK